MTGRDYHLGDLVAYPTNKHGRPRTEAYGKVHGFRLASNNHLLGGYDKRPREGFVEVLGDDSHVRSFRRSQLRLVLAFDAIRPALDAESERPQRPGPESG